MTKERKDKKRILPVHPASIAVFGLGLAGAAVQTVCIFSAPFSDFINSTVGAFLRFVLANIFAVFPFSFMELLLFASPLIVAVAVYSSIKSAKAGKVFLCRTLCGILSVAAGVYFCFAVGFAPGYRGATLDKKIGLELRKVTKDELYAVTLTVIDELNPIAENINLARDGASYMPMSLSRLSDELCASYGALEQKYSFINSFPSRVKPLIISPLMTYTHLSGIYSFFTGEANVNTNYPDFVVAYTAAHEMAHQRGIAREDEANFIAFLAMRESEDEYVRYAAYLNMYEYLSNALYTADYELWQDASLRLCANARSELSAYSVFFDRYRESQASKVADSLNNAYLESQGTEGTVSYDMVVELAVSFYLD